MPLAYRALVFDYDGTLTHTPRPDDSVLRALARARAAGQRLVLATGRILGELRADFPDVEDHFDALVLENGAVIRTALGHRLSVAPVPSELDAGLRAAGVPFRRGESILATRADATGAALQVLNRLGLDCQLIRNRAELMILPAGVSKATGVREALGDLEVSLHSAIAVGDAENDLAMIESCELSVAVADAVEALKARADVVLTQPDGDGIVSLIDGPLTRNKARERSRRWQVELGEGVRVPGSGVNVLIAGESGCGKSYLAGLLAERLIQLGYSLCVLDPEGDYEALTHLRGVRVVGGERPLPDPEDLGAVLRHRLGSVIVDLSHCSAELRHRYLPAALGALQRLRDETGTPHWIFVDEAHVPMSGEALPLDPAQKGLCLVTYQPLAVSARALDATDVFLMPHSPAHGVPPALLALAGVAEPVEAVCPGWQALWVDGRGSTPTAFQVPSRTSAHVRHWHKYMHAQLPEPMRFLFRSPRNDVLCVAGNVTELHQDLLGVPGASIAHHAARGDLSRWAREALQDEVLAKALGAAERCLPQGADAVRHALLTAVEQRYLENGPSANPRRPRCAL